MRFTWMMTGSLILALAATGCDDAPTPEEVNKATAQRAAQMLREVGAASQMLNGFSALDSLNESAHLLSTSFEAVPLDGTTCAEQDGGCSAAAEPLPSTAPLTEADVNASTEAFEKFLRERIFTQANVESEDGDSTTFRIQGDDACEDGDPATPVSPSCVEEVDRLELRLRATRVGDDAMDLTVILGPQRAEPVKLGFAPRTFAWTVSLEGTKAAIEFLSPETELPRVLEGTFEMRLTRHGEKDFSLSSSVLEAIRVEVDQEGEGTIRFTTAASSNVSLLRLEGPARRLSFDMNLGPTEFSYPYSTAAAPKLAGNRMTYHLDGLSFAFSAQEGQEDFVVAHVGLGEAQSFIDLDGTKLATADLNEVSGRHFDVNLTRGADGLPTVRVLPQLDYVTKLFLQPLTADADADVPAFYLNETYRVLLGGSAAPALKPVRANAATGFPGGLRVVSGELRLEAKNAGASVVVPEGSCLVSRDLLPEGAHELLGHFEPRACE